MPSAGRTIACLRRSERQGNIAIARFPVTPGAHDVRVELADTPNADNWTRQWTQSVEFNENRVRVLLFDAKAGFTLH